MLRDYSKDFEFENIKSDFLVLVQKLILRFYRY